ATTIFDYVRRAMPPDAPGSLKDNEVYGLVAYLLTLNELIPADAVIDATSLAKVKMPAHDRFVPDTRVESKPAAKAKNREDLSSRAGVRRREPVDGGHSAGAIRRAARAVSRTAQHPLRRTIHVRSRQIHNGA